MKLVRALAETRADASRLRRERGALAFVPTMGALHDGHRSLVERARETAGATALSIFVNPLQFAPGEDFEAYPRDLQRDAALAEAWGVDLVFAPEAAELVPSAAFVTVDPGPLGERLEGRSRPGHFRGVLTIVAKLLNVVRPDVAVFGRKDLQQAVLVRAMLRDLNFDVRLAVPPTVRDPDGLALSSRNANLSAAERLEATALHRALRAGERAILDGERRPGAVRDAILRVLAEAPAVRPDYVTVVREEDLAELDRVRGPTALLVAARVGGTRLIDNLVVAPEDERG